MRMILCISLCLLSNCYERRFKKEVIEKSNVILHRGVILMKESLEKNKVILSGQEVEYVLTRKRVKNINLRIKSDATISVSAPYSTDLCQIENFMVSKSDYILTHIRRFQSMQANISKNKEYIDGESFYLLGENIRLKVLQDTQENVWTDGVFLYLTIQDTNNKKRKQLLVEGFFGKQREEVFQEIIDTIYPVFSKYGIAYPIIKMRTMKTRWGSCIPSKEQITLNTTLIETPRICIEYVVLHEFSHFIHPNHSKAFYDFVAILMPDWKERKECLEKFAFRQE